MRTSEAERLYPVADAQNSVTMYSAFTRSHASGVGAKAWKGGNRPVKNVTWNDAVYSRAMGGGSDGG